MQQVARKRPAKGIGHGGFFIHTFIHSYVFSVDIRALAFLRPLVSSDNLTPSLSKGELALLGVPAVCQPSTNRDSRNLKTRAAQEAVRHGG